MAKQIKAYVEVEPYVEVVKGRGSDPAALLASTLVVDDFGDALARLAEAATGAGTPTRILSGPHGTGKSTLLTVLYTLAGFPEQRSRSQQQAMRTASSYFSGTRVVPVFVDPAESNAASFDAAVAEAVVEASAPASAAGIPASEWEAAAASADPIAHALRLLPPGGRLVVIVDGVSAWLRVAEREAARDAVAALSKLGELAESESVSVLAALDEESLAAHGAFVPLVRTFQVQYLPLRVLQHICDLHLFKKEPRQRAELGALYNGLARLVPGFRWSREEFVAAYPLHPSAFEVASALRRYAPGFSLPRFAAAAGNRAKGRRELSLVVLDELFDTTEYELRKTPEMASAFEVYDDFANVTIPKLAESQQRLWAKLVLKGLFLFSLAGRAVTARELAAAMMLYDERDPEAGPRTVAAIFSAFEERAAQRFVIEGEGDARSYRLPTADEGAAARAVYEIAREIPADDPRIADTLVGLGAERFADWPAGFGRGSGNATLDVPWRGTWRSGLLSYRVPTEMVAIPPVEADLPLADADPLADLGDDILSVNAALDAPAAAVGHAAEPAVERMVVTFSASPEICEHDWEVAIAPLGARADAPVGPATLVRWVPGEPDDAEVLVLRRLAALRSGDARLEAAGVDLEALEAEAEAEGGLVFHHLYLDEGRFVGPSWEVTAADHAARETLGGMLSHVLDAPLGDRYPQHPQFAGEVDEAVERLLVEKFFVGGATTPNVQQAAAAIAAPLGLAEASDHGPYRFNPNGEAALSFAFNVEPLRLAEAAGENGVPLDAVYQALRREPFGLQRPAQRLVLAAMVASGRLMLTGPAGELTAAGLGAAGDLEGYTHLRRAGLTVYPNETLLEWARLVADADHLNDLVTADGRNLIRQALVEWLERWRELNLAARFSEVPAEAATRRTWQLISASKQYFDSTARSVRAILNEEVPLEEGLGRIVTTFAANPTLYQRALRDLRMLTSFVDWVGFYTYAKEFILAADRTAEPKIEAQRAELVDFISAPHRLLDESKRRRFETVYETFLQDYTDYYVSAHDLHVGTRSDFEALNAFLDGEVWTRFQLLSHVRVVNGRYYQFAAEFVQEIRDLACDLPARDVLHERPSCVCGFRLGDVDGFARMFERLRLLVEQGTRHHIQTIRQFRQPILMALRRMEADAAYADASVPLIGLLSSNDAPTELTPSTIDLVNRCLTDQPLPVAVAAPPLEFGQAVSKDELRARLTQWLDELPGGDGVFIEIARALPVAGDE
jgi:hypothetical protein